MPESHSASPPSLSTSEQLLVSAFGETHGEGHLLLACYAAFPMVLTADLVYKIWQNFRNYTREDGTLHEIPYVAVSDLLMSPLCQPSGYRRFEMMANVRHFLLAVLQDDPRYGKTRLRELALFLKHYIESTYRDTADATGQAMLKAQQLMVDAWLQPEKALQALTRAFRETEQSPAEQVRLGNLVERFNVQWEAGLLDETQQKPAQTQALLQYSQSLKAFHKTGNAYDAANLLTGVIRQGDINGLVLPLPVEVRTAVTRRLSLPKKGKLFALLIAIDEYHPDSKIQPLRGCKRDVQKIAGWLEKVHQSENSPWQEIDVEMLFDQDATIGIVQKYMALLQNLGAEDQALIYFAGHARQGEGTGEPDLVFYDSLLPNVAPQTISRFRNLVLSNASRQPYITLLLDTEFTGLPQWLDPLNDKHVVFANSGPAEHGYEVGEGEGFFTKYLVEALEAGHGAVSNARLFAETLRGMATDPLSEQQHPQFYATQWGQERPFLQPSDLMQEMKGLLRATGMSLAALRERLGLPDSTTRQQWIARLKDFIAEKEKTDAPLLLFVFSDMEGSLPGVQQEHDQLKTLVEQQTTNTLLEAVFLLNPDTETLQSYFTRPEYRNRLHGFHFSGSAKDNRPVMNAPIRKKAVKKAPPMQQQSNSGSMSFSNANVSPETTTAYGLLLPDDLLDFFDFTSWLPYQQNLRLVFFNACYTDHMAAWTSQLGAWNAIGVEEEVNDEAACQFSMDFYGRWMQQGNVLADAFSESVEAFLQGYPTTNSGSGASRGPAPPKNLKIRTPDLPFQLNSAVWLSTGWRGERFSDYHLIADAGIRALVQEYDSIDVSDKSARVGKKMQLSQKIGEVINATGADKNAMVDGRSSQGLLAGIVVAIQQRLAVEELAVLLKIAPLAKHMFVKYQWVLAAADLLKKSGPEKRVEAAAVYGVMEQFEPDADSDLRQLILSMSGIKDLYTPNDLLETANSFYKTEQWGKAAFCYNRVIRLDPENTEAYFKRAIFLEDALNQKEEALADYNKVLQINPKDSNAYINRGLLYEALESPQEALADYSTAIAIQPDDEEAYNARGVLLAKLGRREEAVADYDKALSLNPAYIRAYFNRGEVYENLGRKEEALADYNKVIALNPDYADIYHYRGLLLADMGRKEEALADYNKALQLNPDDGNTYNNRGVLLAALGRAEEALADYNKALELNPDDAQRYNNRGLLLADLGRKEEALADYNKVVALHPDDGHVYNNRGLLLADMGRKEEALADYNKALQLNPDDVNVYNNRGLLLAELGQEEEAMASYDKALQLNPAYGIAYISRGALHERLGRKAEALADYNRAVALQPNDANAFNYRGNFYRHQQNYEAAFSDVKRAIVLDPDDAYAYGTLAEIHAQLGEDEDFYTELETALSKGYPITEFLENDPAYARYQGQSRFLELLKKYGRADEGSGSAA